jgi:lia operon protein LiaF
MNRHFVRKMMWGTALIVVGILFLMKQTGWLDIDLGTLIHTYWPLLIVGFGLKGLLFYRHTKRGWGGSFFWNLLVIMLGLYFLMNNLGFEGYSYSSLYKYMVPVLLILFGLSMLFRSNHRSDEITTVEQQLEQVEPPYKDTHEATKWQRHGHTYSFYDQDGKQNRSSFIGDIHLGKDYWNLVPMNISHFIGDTVIDLTKARIPSGETKLNVSAFIGDVKLFIPNDVEIEVSVSTSVFLGDMRILDRHESGMFKQMSAESPFYSEAEKKIRLNVSMFIGDVIVKRVG